MVSLPLLLGRSCAGAARPDLVSVNIKTDLLGLDAFGELKRTICLYACSGRSVDRFLVGYKGSRDRLSLECSGSGKGPDEMQANLASTVDSLAPTRQLTPSVLLQTRDQVMYGLLSFETKLLLVISLPDEGVSGVQRGNTDAI